jgi:hypothetical protein
MNIHSIFVAAAIAVSPSLVLAQGEGAPISPPAASSMASGRPGMMGGGMMGRGMMDPDTMMSMMRQMTAPEHIEGVIAYLKTELKINEAQQPLWNAFADALRANAHGMTDLMTGMHNAMTPAQTAPTLPQRIEFHEKMLAAHLEGLRQIKAALQPLYAALDDSQKRAADELVAAGLMGRM